MLPYWNQLHLVWKSKIQNMTMMMIYSITSLVMKLLINTMNELLGNKE